MSYVIGGLWVALAVVMVWYERWHHRRDAFCRSPGCLRLRASYSAKYCPLHHIP